MPALRGQVAAGPRYVEPVADVDEDGTNAALPTRQPDALTCRVIEIGSLLHTGWNATRMVTVRAPLSLTLVAH